MRIDAADEMQDQTTFMRRTMENEIYPWFLLEAVEACLEDYGEPVMAGKLISKAVEDYQVAWV
jgi:hypothetical protein